MDVVDKDVDVDKEIIFPEVTDLHELEESEGGSNNIETVFEISAVFPNASNLSEINGGYQTMHEFKKSTLDIMNTSDSDKTETVIARCSNTVLGDYIDTNLLKAFPIAFSYGVGNLDNEGNHRCGTSYLQYLITLSSPVFHEPEFFIIIHNIYERKRMVTQAFLKVSEEEG